MKCLHCHKRKAQQMYRGLCRTCYSEYRVCTSCKRIVAAKDEFGQLCDSCYCAHISLLHTTPQLSPGQTSIQGLSSEDFARIEAQLHTLTCGQCGERVRLVSSIFYAGLLLQVRCNSLPGHDSFVLFDGLTLKAAYSDFGDSLWYMAAGRRRLTNDDFMPDFEA